MKATGIVRPIDNLGRLVIPMELRKTLGIRDGDAFEIYTEEDRIILHIYQPEWHVEATIEKLEQQLEDNFPVTVAESAKPAIATLREIVKKKNA